MNPNMTFDACLSTLSNYNSGVQRTAGTDCSEYAEQASAVLGLSMFTLYCVNTNGRLAPFYWYNYAGDLEAYCYHTFCVTKCGSVAMVLDCSIPQNMSIQYLDEFKRRIMDCNQGRINNGTKFAICEGDVDEEGVHHLVLRKRARNFISWSYKHHNEKVLAYTVLSGDIHSEPEILGIYTLGSWDKVPELYVKISVIKPADEFNRSNIISRKLHRSERGYYFILDNEQYFLTQFVWSPMDNAYPYLQSMNSMLRPASAEERKLLSKLISGVRR